MNKKNYIYPFLATSLWGSLYAASKVVLATVPPITVLMFRYLISCVALGLIAKQRHCMKKIPKSDWLAMFGIGFIAYFIANICQLCGTARVGASMASLINALNPITMPVMAAIFLHEKLTPRRCLAIVFAVAGVYIVLGVNTAELSLDYLGVLLSFGCVFFFTIGSLIMRKISGRYDPVEVTLVGMLIALVFNIPASAWELRTSSCQILPITVVCLLYMGIFGTAVAHSLWNKGLKMLDTGTCSMFYPMQPIVTVIIASLFLNEPLTLNFAVGACIIIAAIFVGLSGGRRK